MSAYARLAGLAERRAELASAGAWDDLAAVSGTLDALQASLPSAPPAAARPLLERALLQSQLAEAAIVAALEDTGDELAQLATSRRVVAAYGRA